MATLILRPVSDSNVRHSLSSGSNAYALINELRQDGDSTYIYQYISSTSSNTFTSVFNVGGFNSTKIKVTKCTLYATARSTASATARMQIVVNANGTTASTGTYSLSSSYTTKSANCAGIIDSINSQLENGQTPSITLTVQTAGAKSSSKDDSFQIRLTQVYLEIEYETVQDSGESTGLHIKIDSAYVVVKAVYKKVDGSYVKQNDISGLFDADTRYIKMN